MYKNISASYLQYFYIFYIANMCKYPVYFLHILNHVGRLIVSSKYISTRSPFLDLLLRLFCSAFFRKQRFELSYSGSFNATSFTRSSAAYSKISDINTAKPSLDEIKKHVVGNIIILYFNIRYSRR